MAIVYYDFQGGNGAGTSPADSRNTWTQPSNNDVIRFKRGTVWNRVGQVNLASVQGLTFETYYNADGTDDITKPKPIITVSMSAGTSAINIQGTGIHVWRNIIFRDFVYTPDPNGSIPNAITFGTTGTYGVDPGVSGEIWYCEFYNIPGNAANFNGNNSASTPNLAADRMRVMHCVFDNIGGDCVFGQAKDVEIAYNRMTRMSMRTETGDGVGLLFFNPTRCWIHDNYIDHRDTNFKHCIIVDGTDGTGNTLVENNELLGIETVGINLDQVVGIARGNTITTKGIGFSSNTDGVQFINNKVFANGWRADAAATVGILASNAKINNNTFICSTKGGTLVGTGTGRSGIEIKNNTVINGDVFYLRGGGTTDTCSNNAFENTTTLYSGGASGINDIVNNLQVRSTGEPLNTSPLLTNGANLGWQRDIKGKLGKSYIGAFSTTGVADERGTAVQRQPRQ